MTTIVYRDGVIAVDSLGTYGQVKVPGNCENKLRALADGSIAAMLGNAARCERLVYWIESQDGEQPDFEDDTIVVMGKSGTVEIYENGSSYVETAPFMAYGSGQAAALGALHAGASAEEAVKIAILVDTNTGGPVQSRRTSPAIAAA